MASPRPISPGASDAAWPVYPMDGRIAALEMLKPRPMLPARSMAALPIHRNESSGA